LENAALRIDACPGFVGQKRLNVKRLLFGTFVLAILERNIKPAPKHP